MKRQKVGVVIYSHRHGEDVWVYQSMKKAWKGAARTAFLWQVELDDKDRRTFLRLFRAGKYQDAVEHYIKSHPRGDEFFVVLEEEVL